VDFPKVVQEFSAAFAQANVRHALAGAMALHALGLSRFTRDLDFVVDEPGRPVALATADRLGYERLRVSEAFSNHLHRDAVWGRVDFIYVEGRTSELLFANARPLPVFSNISVLVPKPEHVIAMKVQAVKEAPDRAHKDLPDIASLMTLPGVDEQQVRGYFERHGLLWRFEQLQALRNR
jgi:hypothetical protein